MANSTKYRPNIIKYYEIQHREKGENHWNRSIKCPGNVTHYEITGLKSNTSYECRIRAFGEPKPNSPKNLRLQARSNSVLLKWDKPDEILVPIEDSTTEGTSHWEDTKRGLGMALPNQDGPTLHSTGFSIADTQDNESVLVAFDVKPVPPATINTQILYFLFQDIHQAIDQYDQIVQNLKTLRDGRR